MRDHRHTSQCGTVAPVTLAATAFVALITIFGLTLLPDGTTPEADIRIEPTERVVGVDKTFEVRVVVESAAPVNVFSGELRFDPDVLAVSSIEYNTMVADLWAELPWYSNGNGTLNFGGGTTQEGGFEGVDTLIKIQFRTLKAGTGTISMDTSRILLHDGLGTDAQLAESRDAIFTISSTEEGNGSSTSSNGGVYYTVVQEAPSTDLNGDGKQSMGDISVFMLNIGGNDLRYDFNLDGEVNVQDLNILLDAY